jgi:hypothetical protein
MPQLSKASAKTASRRPKHSPAKELAGFIAKFDPSIAGLIRGARRDLRRRLPAAVELVYDNYNFLVIGYCSTERSSSCIVTIAAASSGVSLGFYYGAGLPDPHHILQGSGKQHRFVRLKSAATLAEPPVEALIREAIARAKIPLQRTGGGYTIIKSVSAKQRPRRV